MIKWKKQHSAAIFISFLNNLKEMIISIIAVFIFGQSSQAGGSLFYTIFFALILVFSLGSGIIRWATFEYQLLDNELQIKQGLIFKKHRYIRKERIQSIDINAKLIQRLFQLVEIRIETAGGGTEPEFRIIALKRREAELIKEELLVRKSNLNNGDQDHSEVINEESLLEENKKQFYTWNLSFKRLLISAITSSGLGLAITFVAAVISQLPQLLPNTIYERVLGLFIHSSILLISFFVVLILFIGWLITLISSLLKYGQFHIKKDKDDIHISRGILEKRQLTLSAKRITAVRVVQNLLRQPLGYAAVYVESAGGGRKEEDLSTILIPICKKSEVNSILNNLLPQFSIKENEYKSLPKESVRRYMIKASIPFIFLAILMTYFIPYGWISFILPLGAAGIGFWQYIDAGIGNNDEMLLIKSRMISLTEVIVPRKRIQAMTTSQTILQKVDHLYTVQVSIISSIVGKTFSLRHISKNQIENLFLWYSYECRKHR
ncbi:PH domain-containing protein [Evansella sp. AB-P1]|uniref:PH domain-containing protein n=1 Tax=Evansella sp. AB-P1 TaxID=3037653 RepID=UPI00241DBD69|nr:PH domain-containing protein [Evansella sp. AB-P1]MDG5787538.1 PH domain-containing protein [Evansella sp. AB-P1]